MVRKAMTVGGVTSSWNTEYTPTLMTTSWIMAKDAAAGNLHPQRIRRVRRDAARNTTRARSADLVISLPHDGPTVLTVTSEASVLARSASTWRTSSCLPSDEAVPWTRSV